MESFTVYIIVGGYETSGWRSKITPPPPKKILQRDAIKIASIKINK